MKLHKGLLITAVTGASLFTGAFVYSEKNPEKIPAIAPQQAIEIALEAMPGSIHELELEKEDGMLLWELELIAEKDNKEYEILINAESGELITIEEEQEKDGWKLFSFFQD